MEKIKNRALTAKTYNLAAIGGLVMGGVLYLSLLLNYLATESTTIASFISFLNIAMICTVLSLFAKRYVALYEEQMVGYGQIYGFILKLMLFAGVLYGSLYYVQSNIIDPDYFRQLQDTVVENSGMIAESDVTIAKGTMDAMMSKPITVIVLSTISTLIYGAMLGLIVAAFARPRPKKGDNNQ